jgi:CheY-like chemotaxis protein
MNKPNDIEIFENPLATYWLDKDGILNMVAKPTIRTAESSRSFFQDIKKLLGGKKVYCISDFTSVKEITEEARDYYKNEGPALFNAVAIISQSEFSRMVAMVLSLLFNPAVPTKVFSNEPEARAWLKELRATGETIIPPSAAGRKIKGKLVLVDDDPSEEIFLKFALEKGKWNVDLKFFSDPKKALEYLKETDDEIFLVISDINMPGMNGFDFKKEIDANRELSKKAIPFIFASNSASQKDIALAYDNRVHGYFQKPVGIDEATNMLDKIFNYWLICRHPYKQNY